MKIIRLSVWFLVAVTIAAMVASLTGMVEPKSTMWESGQAISINEELHVSLMNNRLVFYNSLDYGPYRGSMLSLEGDPDPPIVKGFGDWLGIYYRNIGWSDGVRLLTLAISLWYPLILFGAMALICESRGYIRRRRRKHPSPTN